MKPNPNQIQQGDVRLERIEALPEGSKIIKRAQHGIILAESAQTMNRHFITSREAHQFAAPDESRCVVNEADKPVELMHSKEHEPLRIAPGVHGVGGIRELDHLTGMIAPVED